MSGILELRKYSYRLYINLIKPYVKPTTLLPSELEQDCVKAFCVLAHAALEEYFELLARNTLKSAYSKFKTGVFIAAPIATQADIDDANKLISQLIKTLVLSSCYSIYSSNQSDTLHTHKSKLATASQNFSSGNDLNGNDLANLTKTTNSYTKDIIKETIKYIDGQIDSNHGASLKYILKILIPVGIDIPQDVALNSLQKLSRYRGEYAHTKGDINQIISPPDVAKYFIDVIKVCQKIEDSIVVMSV